MIDAVALADLVLDRLRTIPQVEVLDGQVATTPLGGYVVFYDEAPRLSSRSLAGVSNRMGWTHRDVCVGRDPGETRHIAGMVLDRLTNWRPLADRSSSWLVPVPTGAPILKDESVPGDIRFSQTLTFRLTATRS